MVTDLYPRGLDPESLASSLTDLGISLRQSGVHVDINLDEQLAVGETTATLVYRVARESVQNALKHAAAQNVEVRLARQDGCVLLTVVDDGRGFDTSAEPAVGHFGLRLIRDTVVEAGGRLLVDSSIGRGTRVALSLPLG
jgi:signal transduction histidine kinase